MRSLALFLLIAATGAAQTVPNIRAGAFCPNYSSGRPPLTPDNPGGAGAFRRVTLGAPNALCNDGSQAVIYVRPARAGATEPDGPSENRWIIHFQGGGSCNDFLECLIRWCGLGFYTARQMSSSLDPENIGQAGLLGRNEINRLGDRNMVLLRYCSSDAWGGRASNIVYTNPENASQSYSLHFQGANIVAAAMAALEAGIPGMPRLTQAADVLVSGDSAGAAGVRRHLDRIAARLKAVNSTVRVRGNVEDAFGPNPHGRQGFPAGDPQDPPYANSMAIYTEHDVPRNTQTDDSCTAAHPSAPFLCTAESYVAANHMTTPFFQIQDLVDPSLMEAFAEAGAIFAPNQFAGAVHAELTSLIGIRNTAIERVNITTDPGVVGRLCGMHVTWGNDDGFLGRKMTHTDGRAYSYYELLWNWMTGQQPVNVIAPKPPETPEVPRPDPACRNGAPNVASPVVATASSASYDFQAPVAPDSIAVTFGSSLAASTVTASTIPWPTSLGGVQIAVRDATGVVRQAPIYFVSPSQVLYLIPAGTAPGTAEITIGAQRFNVQVTATSPSIYAANQAGTGVAAATFLRVRSGQQTSGLLFDPVTNAAVPIGARAGDQVYLLLYGTGLRGGPATATVGGVNVPVAGPVAQSQYPGLDQINLGPLPLAVGAGLKEIVIRQGERTSNPVTVTFRRE